MTRAITLTLAALASLALALAGPAASFGKAKRIPYVGKTSSGHKITFTVKGNRVYAPLYGLRMSCLAIQGGGDPLTGAEYVKTTGSLKFGEKAKFKYMDKPSLGYTDVTKSNEILFRRGRKGLVTGTLRMQYSFLVPKYVPGTFTIYSCLGKVTFKARPKHR